MKDPDVRPKRVCSPKYAVQKARKGKALNRWEIEDLAKDAELSLIYAQRVLKGRFPEAEPTISQYPDYALQYAMGVIGGRFPEAEPGLVRVVEQGYGGNKVIERYFIEYGIQNPAVEKAVLSRFPNLIPKYAMKCLGGRWAEAEKSLLAGRLDGAVDYHHEVIEGRWPEFEERIIFGKNLSYWDNPRDCFKKYLRKVGGSDKEIEGRLSRSNKASLILAYAIEASKGRLPPELHQKMMMFIFDPKRQRFAKRYIKFLEKAEEKVVRYLAGLDESEVNDIVERSRTK